METLITVYGGYETLNMWVLSCARNCWRDRERRPWLELVVELEVGRRRWSGSLQGLESRRSGQWHATWFAVTRN